MAKPNSSDDKQESKDFVPQNMNLFIIFRGFATFYLFFLAYQSITRYINTPEDRPTILFMVFSTVILVGGGLFVLIVSLLQYKKYKAQEAAAKARAAEEAAAADEETDDAEDAPCALEEACNDCDENFDDSQEDDPSEE